MYSSTFSRNPSSNGMMAAMPVTAVLRTPKFDKNNVSLRRVQSSLVKAAVIRTTTAELTREME